MSETLQQTAKILIKKADNNSDIQSLAW